MSYTRKIGWMVRESADEAAASMNAVYHGDGLTVLQWRELRGAYMRDPEDEIFFPKKKAQIIQLERIGKTLTMRAANFGEPLQVVGSHDMPFMKDSVLAGIFIGSQTLIGWKKLRCGMFVLINQLPIITMQIL